MSQTKDNTPSVGLTANEVSSHLVFLFKEQYGTKAF